MSNRGKSRWFALLLAISFVLPLIGQSLVQAQTILQETSESSTEVSSSETELTNVVTSTVSSPAIETTSDATIESSSTITEDIVEETSEETTVASSEMETTSPVTEESNTIESSTVESSGNMVSTAELLQADKVTLTFENSSLQTAYKNAVFVNGEFFQYLENISPFTLEIPVDRLNASENRITFICGSSATGTYYDESVAPQTRNHNDPNVKNLVVNIDGFNYSPTSLVKYTITDQTIPAASSHNTVEENYKEDTNYKFGDGSPNGSPHPASLTVPYKIDFVFDFSTGGEAEPTENPDRIIKQVNAHVGGEAATSKNLSWVTVQNTETEVIVKDSSGASVYTNMIFGTSNGKVYTYTVELMGLTPNSSYTYTLSNDANAIEGNFRTAVASGSTGTVRFGYISDPQVSNSNNAKATGAVFNQLQSLSEKSPLDFLYIAGDHTNTSDAEDQWQALFHNGGLFPNATQDFLLNNTLLSTQGNHDVADFNGHINTPDELGQGEFLAGTYSVDYGQVRFVVVNNASYNTSDLANNSNFQLVVKFLQDEVEDAKSKGMWTIVGFHKPLYTGASHISDGDVVAYRKVLNPVLSELDVDFVLAGHDHVYSRGFVDADGNNATIKNKTLTDSTGRLTFGHVAHAPFHMVAEHAGGLKWYNAVNYTADAEDPIAPNYEFLDKNSATESPTSSSKQEQTYVVVEVKADQTSFITYKFKYDKVNDRFETQPYIYDTFVVTKAETPMEDQEPVDVPEEPKDTVMLSFTASSLQPAYNNALFVNGEFYQFIPSNNENSIEIPRELFTKGVNTIGFMPGSNQTGTYYNVEDTPETRNHNDPKVMNIVLKIDEVTYTPNNVISHYIINAQTPAAVDSRVESSGYDPAINYQFGDGQPGGTPHPASTQIPYLLTFGINLEAAATGEANWDVTDGQIYSGTKVVSATVGNATDVATIRVGETTVPSTGSGMATFTYNSSGIQANDGNQFKNGLLVNGEQAEYLNENKPSLPISDSLLAYGEKNIISIMIGTTSGVYNETLIPGAINHDDFSVWDFGLLLPNGTKVLPNLVRTYRALDINTPASVQNIVTEELYAADTKFSMGDGYPAGTNLNYYYKIDLVFDLPTFDPLTRYFDLDTKEYPDGPQTMQLVVNNAVEKEANVIFDNTAPEISTNLPDGAVQDQTQLTVTVKDTFSEIAEIKTLLDGVEVTVPYLLDSEELGTVIHFLTVLAKDTMGNEATERISFQMQAKPDILIDADGQQNEEVYEFNVYTDDSLAGPLTVDYFKATSLDVTTTAGQSEGDFSVEDASEIPVGNDGFVTSQSSTALPYQLYTVRTNGQTGTISVSLTAKVNPGETAVLKVFNPTNKEWENVSAKRSFGADVILNADVDILTYEANNEIQFAVTQQLVDNGSDVFAWFTDTQYYTQRQPLIDTKIYELMTTYLRDEYLAGRIGYVAHTGDIIENVDNETQYKLAAAAHDILDDANVPNGVTTGNHDVGDVSPTMRYGNFGIYFGADRYSNQPWYGGEYGNNTHHYDLVTVGGHDLIVLYLGMGLEAKPETIEWANHALQMYPNRTGIIATHQYLSPSSRWITYSRAEEIYKQIIVPNPNVALTISGHDPGAARNIRSTPDGRQLVEILSDYQHQPNGGDGFLRLMEFTETGLNTVTYSPVVDRFNSFSAAQDEFSENVGFVENHRMIASKNFTAVVKGVGETPEVESSGNFIQRFINIFFAPMSMQSATPSPVTPFATTQVEAGKTATVTLEIEEIDFSEWYATVTDANGKVVRTAIIPIELTAVESTSPSSEAETSESQPLESSSVTEPDESSVATESSAVTEPSESSAVTEPSESSAVTEPNDSGIVTETRDPSAVTETSESSVVTESSYSTTPATTSDTNMNNNAGSTTNIPPAKTPSTGESSGMIILGVLILLAASGLIVWKSKKEKD